jgi:hypothetical protein
MWWINSEKTRNGMSSAFSAFTCGGRFALAAECLAHGPKTIATMAGARTQPNKTIQTQQNVPLSRLRLHRPPLGPRWRRHPPAISPLPHRPRRSRRRHDSSSRAFGPGRADGWTIPPNVADYSGPRPAHRPSTSRCLRQPVQAGAQKRNAPGCSPRASFQGGFTSGRRGGQRPLSSDWRRNSGGSAAVTDDPL